MSVPHRQSYQNDPMTTTSSAKENDEDLVHTKTLFRRRSKGPVMFNGCSPSGDVIIIDNISPKKHYDLTGWYIERQTDSKPILRYTFPDRLIVPPSTTIELWSSTATPIPTSTANDEQQAFLTIKTPLLTWHHARQWSITRLFDSTGREKAIFLHRTLTQTEQRKNE